MSEPPRLEPPPDAAGSASSSPRGADAARGGDGARGSRPASKPDEEIVPYVEHAGAASTPGVPLRFATDAAALRLWPRRGRHLLRGAADQGRGQPAPSGEPRLDRRLRRGGRAAALRPRPLAQPCAGTARSASWDVLLAALLPELRGLRARAGRGLRLLTGRVTSPTLLRQIDAAAGSGSRSAGWHALRAGRRRECAARGERWPSAARSTSLPRARPGRGGPRLDADPLGPGPDQIRNARGFAARRTVRRHGAALRRLYAMEPRDVADRRQCRQPARPGAAREIRDTRAWLSRRRSAPAAAARAGAGCAPLPRAVAARPAGAPGRARWCWPAKRLPPELHALGHWINARLGGAGRR